MVLNYFTRRANHGLKACTTTEMNSTAVFPIAVRFSYVARTVYKANELAFQFISSQLSARE